MQHTLRRMVWALGALALAAWPTAAHAQIRRDIVLRVQTTVLVPDGGTVTLGGYSQYAESRSEYGVPVLAQTPYLGRGFGNVASGRSVVAGRVTATVRIIDLREEEYRQTGYRSP
jgi:general secretion pathway protein D